MTLCIVIYYKLTMLKTGFLITQLLRVFNMLICMEILSWGEHSVHYFPIYLAIESFFHGLMFHWLFIHNTGNRTVNNNGLESS